MENMPRFLLCPLLSRSLSSPPRAPGRELRVPRSSLGKRLNFKGPGPYILSDQQIPPADHSLLIPGSGSHP